MYPCIFSTAQDGTRPTIAVLQDNRRRVSANFLESIHNSARGSHRIDKHVAQFGFRVDVVRNPPPLAIEEIAHIE
jgi:hypothetical protein